MPAVEADGKQLVGGLDDGASRKLLQKAHGRVRGKGNVHTFDELPGIGVPRKQDARKRASFMILKGDDVPLAVDFLKGGKDVARDDVNLLPAFLLAGVEQGVQRFGIAARFADGKGIFLPYGL